ncbi:MAG: 6-carboxytetrahydropterin synthase [Burkholderiaceae bacterium]|nr:6-carboxytetrahydropterin synthase [Burkholderiaceae bacterium]MCD8516997.1 6-carboxytetrahydropterin synthase [Burkholderiaceae bacterium]MCD8537665.1 6-carboxytetrahydropterin synthase [Burkholderiaceae bacterium]
MSNSSPDLKSSLATEHVASARFEAARQIAAATDGSIDKFNRLHGHGFLVSAFVDPSLDLIGGAAAAPLAAWPPYVGGEVPALSEQLQTYSQQLDYQSLNDIITDPTDINIARWFASRFSDAARVDPTFTPTAARGVCAIALQSTPDQGVVVGVAVDALVWRRYRFQAAHQLPNVRVGHKCGRLHGHGFEVVLYARSDQGTVASDKTDYDTLDRAWAQVSGLLCYRCLNDIPGLENPTSEMLSSWLWQRLIGVLPTLTAVSVYETASCGATFDGERYRIWKDFTIDSAVRYRHAARGGVGTDLDDPRARVHGYTYTLRLNLSAPLDQVMGWTVDFGDVKEVFNPVFKALDHHPLHENAELSLVSDGDTGSMAQWLFAKTQDLLPSLVRVDLFETEGCGSSVGTDLQGPVLPLVRA